MKIIKLFEDYIISPDAKTSTLLNNLTKQIKNSFEGDNDVFSEEEQAIITLIDVERSTVNDSTEKNLIINFEDNDYYYQVIFIIMPYSSKEINKYDGYVKITLYDLETSEVLVSDHFNISILDDKEGVKVQFKEETGQPSQIPPPVQQSENIKYNKYRKIFEANELQADVQGQPQQMQDSQTQAQGGYILLEKYIIEKVSELKDRLEKNKQE